jgi:hypothetical protein
MRFSLKWLLAGTVYLAIAAAAFARPHWAYSDALILLTFVAVTYAAIETVFSRGRRQVIAGGFAIAALLASVGTAIAPKASPPARVVEAFAPYTGKFQGEFTIYTARLRSANAAGTMAAGLIGAVLGTVAYRRGRVEE